MKFHELIKLSRTVVSSSNMNFTAKQLAVGVSSLIDLGDAPCSMPLPKAMPGIGKIMFPDDIEGPWDPSDARAFAIEVLKACDEV